MHLSILNEAQSGLLPFLSKFKREFYLVGGTAVAMHIGHRMSIDFDLFKNGTFYPQKIVARFRQIGEEPLITLNRSGQLNLICRQVKFTFFDYGYTIPHLVKIEKYISMPNLLDLAAMKAFALGMRSKWKDYIDLYFIVRDYYTINQISDRAVAYFGSMFSEKLFRSQLNYFKGISNDEPIEFMPGFEVGEAEIKAFLTEAALTGF